VDLSHNGFTVSFGGAETLAPPDVVVRGVPASLTVGVAPAHPGNAVDVVYRVDDGLAQTLCARELRTDHAANVQYFRANFPKFTRGSRVDYFPLAHCAGGVRVPAPGRERELMATFALADAPPAAAVPVQQRVQRFDAQLTHLASVQVWLEPPFVFGDTPEGFHAAFHVDGGTLDGAPLTGVIRDDSVIELRVRPGGLGVAELHLTALTQSGALVSLTLPGKIDFGSNGYQRFAVENSATGSFQMLANVETGARDLAWLNRTNALAVGCFDLNQRSVTFDLLQTKTVRMK